MSRLSHRLAALAALLCIGSPFARAADVSIPYTFTAHTPALAAQVNANFAAVATGVNGSTADIAALQQALASLQASLAAQQTTIDSLNATVASQKTKINTLTTQMAAVQGSSVMALAANLNMINVPDPNDAAISYPTAEFRGINVRIVNGMGSTESINGLGNLTVGYNETNPNALMFCSNGAYATQATYQAGGGIWASNQRGGSHNLIVGAANAYSQYGGLVAGFLNIVSRGYASVSGGSNNTTSGGASSVSGGQQRTASGAYNRAAGTYSASN